MPETKRRICVIGASGVVGSHVCQTALRKGYKVRAAGLLKNQLTFTTFSSFLTHIKGQCLHEGSR